MTGVVKRVVKKTFYTLGLEIRRIPGRMNQASRYSNFGEEVCIDAHLSRMAVKNRYCVDIGASDGVTMSNTYFLFQRGWTGLAVECDRDKFAKLAWEYAKFPGLNLSNCMVTPDNVIPLFRANQVPKEFSLLSLDIDGYDCFVLQQILKSHRPALLCVEINEKIPPPLKFTVKWDSNYVYAGDNFYGQSLSQLCHLCNQNEYALVELHYNNAFLIPYEINRSPSLIPAEAFQKGYLSRPDRKERFAWNAEFEDIYSLPPPEALAFVNKIFSRYKGKYICTI